jgi:hypothetical protein
MAHHFSGGCMKRVGCFCCVLLLYFCLLNSTYAASITSVTADRDPVPQYERLEFTVTATNSYSNPFNPNEIDLWGEFTSPTSDTIRVNGFWDGTNWKIRFAGAKVGQWSYVVKMADAVSTAEQAGAFSVTSSPHPGWIRTSTKDPRYLEHNNGKPFYGVGVAIPWLLYPRDSRFYAPYEDLMLQLQQNGCNMFYYLMAAWWDNLLVTDSTGYDRYDMTHAANIDQIVTDAELHNITILFSIWFNIMLADETHPWTSYLGYYGWMYNPFRNLTSCTDFFSAPIAWEYQTRLYRYIMARWGYSRAILMWYPIAEIEGTNAIFDPLAMENNPAGWHNKINDYFKSNDPFGHPTTSATGTEYWEAGYQVTDCPQIHTYESQYDVNGIANRVAYWTDRLFASYAKPNFIGEFGKPNHEGELSTRFLHNGIWAGLMSGTCVAPIHWWGGLESGDWSVFSEDMFDQLYYLRNFVDLLDMAAYGLRPADVSTTLSNGKIWGLAGEPVSLCWLQDTTPGETVSNASITFNVLAPGNYDIKFYDTWNGTWLPELNNQFANAGQLNFMCPAFINDIAVKIERSNTCLYTEAAINNFDADLEGWSILSLYSGSDPEVIYDDFESYANTGQLNSLWVNYEEDMDISLETTEVHSGAKSMKITYNTGYMQNFKNGGLPDENTLTLWFKGSTQNDLGNVIFRFLHDWDTLGDFYYSGGTLMDTWTKWEIDCSAVDMSAVNKIVVGTNSANGSDNAVYFDDISFSGSSGSFGATASFDGSKGESGSGGSCRVDVENMTSGEWSDLKVISGDLNSMDCSNYDAVEFSVYVPYLGGELLGIPFAISGPGDTYSESIHLQRLMAGKWNHLRIYIDNIASAEDINNIGVKIGGSGLNYNGPIYIDTVKGIYKKPSDINGDGTVDLKDLSLFAATWLDDVCGADGDMDGNCDMTMVDFAKFAGDWLCGL